MQAQRDCQSIQLLLADFSVANLGSRAEEQVRTHLDTCPACSSELRKLDAVMQLIGDAGAVEPPAGLWSGVYNRIADSESTVGSPTPSRLHVYDHRLRYAILAVTTGLIILTALVFSPRQPGTLPGTVAAEYVEGHAMGAGSGLFADRFSLASMAAVAESEKR